MRRLLTLGLGCCVLASPLYAALKPGAQAPAFTTPATLAGKPSFGSIYLLKPISLLTYIPLYGIPNAKEAFVERNHGLAVIMASEPICHVS